VNASKTTASVMVDVDAVVAPTAKSMSKNDYKPRSRF